VRCAGRERAREGEHRVATGAESAALQIPSAPMPPARPPRSGTRLAQQRDRVGDLRGHGNRRAASTRIAAARSGSSATASTLSAVSGPRARSGRSMRARAPGIRLVVIKELEGVEAAASRQLPLFSPCVVEVVVDDGCPST